MERHRQVIIAIVLLVLAFKILKGMLGLLIGVALPAWWSSAGSSCGGP